MTTSAHARGRWAEQRAADDYVRDGYSVVARNWRSPVGKHRGELDLVCRSADTIVFCEVKARRDATHGDAMLKVDAAKQQQVRTLAQLWLIEAQIDLDSVGVRFDVVAVNGTQLTRIEAAF